MSYPKSNPNADQAAFSEWTKKTCTHPPLSPSQAPFYWEIWKAALEWERKRISFMYARFTDEN